MHFARDLFAGTAEKEQSSSTSSMLGRIQNSGWWQRKGRNPGCERKVVRRLRVSIQFALWALNTGAHRDCHTALSKLLNIGHVEQAWIISIDYSHMRMFKNCPIPSNIYAFPVITESVLDNYHKARRKCALKCPEASMHSVELQISWHELNTSHVQRLESETVHIPSLKHPV